MDNLVILPPFFRVSIDMPVTPQILPYRAHPMPIATTMKPVYAIPSPIPQSSSSSGNGIQTPQDIESAMVGIPNEDNTGIINIGEDKNHNIEESISTEQH